MSNEEVHKGHHYNADETLVSAGENVRRLVKDYTHDEGKSVCFHEEPDLQMQFIQLQLGAAQVQALLAIDETLHAIGAAYAEALINAGKIEPL